MSTTKDTKTMAEIRTLLSELRDPDPLRTVMKEHLDEVKEYILEIQDNSILQEKSEDLFELYSYVQKSNYNDSRDAQYLHGIVVHVDEELKKISDYLKSLRNGRKKNGSNSK